MNGPPAEVADWSERELLWAVADSAQMLAARSAAILATITDAIIVFDLDGRITGMNAAAVRLAGVSPAELHRDATAARGAFALHRPDGSELPLDQRPLARVLRGEALSGVELVVTRRGDGSSWVGSFGGGLVRDDEGRAVLGVITVRDVSERIAAERAARESERYLLTVFENAAVGVATLGLDGRFLRVNQRLCEITGYPASELLEITFHQITHPDDLAADLVEAERLRSGETSSYSIEKRYIRKDGTAVWIRLSGTAHRGASGSTEHFIAIIEDISARKLAEQAVVASEARYRSLFEGMTEGFALHEVICDAGGKPVDYRFLEINPAFERLTGLRRADVIGRLKSEVLPHDNPEWIEIYGEVALSGQPIHFDLRSEALGRHYEVFSYCPAPLQFAVLFVDITERMEAQAMLEARVRERTAELESARGYLQRLSRRLVEVQEEERRVVARELHDEAGQALTAVKLHLRLLERSQEGNADTVERVTELRAAVDAVMESLHSLSVRLRPAALDRLGLDRALAQLAQSSRLAGLEVGVRFAVAGPLAPELEITVYRLVQEALTNVARHAHARRAQVVVARLDGRLEIRISDDGVGFDPQAIGGGRLGLLGMRERAELLGGSLRIESGPAGGTAVIAILPL